MVDNPIIALGLFVYLLTLAVIGVAAYLRVESSSDFMVADNNLGVFVSAGTFGATFLSAIGFLGGPGLGYQFGYAILLWGPFMWVIGIGMAVLVASRYRRTPMDTVPEYFKLRYGSDKLQAFAALGMVYGLIFALLPQILGFGVVVNGVLGISFTNAIIVGVALITLYTVIGGFVGVAWTDTLSWLVLSLGLTIIFVLVLNQAGGWTAMHQAAADVSSPAVEGQDPTPEGALVSLTSEGQWPLITILMGFFLWSFGIATHPQYTIRFQSAENVATAVKGILLGSALVVPALLFAVIAGIGIRTIEPTMAADAGPDFAMVYYLLNHAPPILAIIVLGGALSAIISTSDSELLLIGTAFANDIWHNLINPEASDLELLLANRVSVVIVGLIVGILAVTEPGFIAVVGAYAWGVLAVFFFFPMLGGLYWKQANNQGVWACLIVGSLTVIAWSVAGLEGSTQVPAPAPGIVLGGAAFIIVSYLTEMPPEEQWKPFVRPDEVQTAVSEKSEMVMSDPVERDD